MATTPRLEPQPIADGLTGSVSGASLPATIHAAAIALRNVVLGGNLMSLPLLRHPSRFVGYVNEALFLHRALTGAHGLPQRNVFELFPDHDSVSVQFGGLRPSSLSGDTWFHPIASYTADLVALCQLCQLLQPRRVFEIGTLRGYTTLHLALNTPPDARVFTLDLPPDRPAVPALQTTIVDDRHIRVHGAVERYFFDDTAAAGKISRLYGDSATFDYAPYAGTVDLFFIDGAHSYEYVRSDTLNALRCCHPGSVIAWHDFGRFGVNGVTRWLREFSRNHAVYCVPGGSLAYMRIE